MPRLAPTSHPLLTSHSDACPSYWQVEIVGEEEFQPTKLVTKESTYDKGWVYVEALDESIVQSLRTRLAREAKQRLKKVKAAEEAVKKAKSSAKVKS